MVASGATPVVEFVAVAAHPDSSAVISAIDASPRIRFMGSA
jgi:hypothetical protein